MVISIPYFGGWLVGCLVLAGLTSLVMKRQSKHFFTLSHGVQRPFSILDLELPTSAPELAGLLRGINALPGKESNPVWSALRGQLWVDFLFMPGIYGAIFLLCMKAAQLLSWPPSRALFALLAWTQLLAWAFDIIENLTLFGQLATAKPKAPDRDSTPAQKPLPPANQPLPAQPATKGNEMCAACFAAYIAIVSTKWVLALTGGICALSILFYFWVAG